MQQQFLQLFTYLFWPNPGNASYGSPKASGLLLFCALLILLSFFLSFWRKRQSEQLRRLSSSWSSVSFWFGLTGIFLTVARVEQIQYVAMRLWWVVWILCAALYLFFQVKVFRMRYYEVLPKIGGFDPRAKYLPKSRR